MKAYTLACSDAQDDGRMLRLRVSELEASEDRQLRVMDSLRKELGVKDRRLNAIYRRVTVVGKADTVYVPDTIIVAYLDTTLDDGWVRTDISLSPGVVTVKSSVRNETTIVVAKKRETVRPPRRFPLFRLFQRKHTVVTVTAIEGNPWCETKEARSVEVID